MDDLIFYLMMMVLAAMALCIGHGLRDMLRALRAARLPSARGSGLNARARRSGMPPMAR
ncbi:MAG: hypothetical protein Tsb0016_04140 [Sphingomonadales bacterium]